MKPTKQKFRLSEDFAMPDLSDLSDSQILKMTVKLMIGQPKEYVARTSLLGFIRSVDFSVREYNSSRDVMMKFVPSKGENINRMFIAAGHYENLIYNLKRAHLFFRRMKRTPELSLLLVGLKIDKLFANKVHNMRNAILHSEEEIYKGNISLGQPWFVCFYDSKVLFNSIEINHYELANHIQYLHQLVIDIISKLPKKSSE